MLLTPFCLDELQKIAMPGGEVMRGAARTAGNWFKEGYGLTGLGSGWTRETALPRINLGMNLLNSYHPLKASLQKEDPYGLQRSRAERLADFAGSTVGGSVAAGAIMTRPWFQRMMANHPTAGFLASIPIMMGGGTAGAIAGSRLMTAPFRLFHKQPTPQPAQLPSSNGAV